MIFAVGILGILLFLVAILFIIRVEIIHRHLGRRIEEVYSHKNWYKYDIDVHGTYNLALWDYRKWTYKDFFPEEVV
jgi:hypothetical protein